MKIFNKTDGWREKVNFVDENNVVLGYDLSQGCCESAGWFIRDQPSDVVCEEWTDGLLDMPGWVFDINFFKQVEDTGTSSSFGGGGGMVIFRIVKGPEEKFIHIFNIQNGYYCHGFEFVVPGGDIKEGAL